MTTNVGDMWFLIMIAVVVTTVLGFLNCHFRHYDGLVFKWLSYFKFAAIIRGLQVAYYPLLIACFINFSKHDSTDSTV